MVFAWCRFAAAAICLSIGLVFMVLAVFGVNRFHKALNRMHAAALGDTLGILFVFLGLILMRGISLDSLKLFLVILFFWMASPVSGHMISRLEAMTDEELGELFVIRKDKTFREGKKASEGISFQGGKEVSEGISLQEGKEVSEGKSFQEGKEVSEGKSFQEGKEASEGISAPNDR